jgi:CDP-glycerol glycerophosphotransferase (TagB/SpsB family)
VTSDHYESYVSLPEHGAEIVGALLHNFPDYKIIFRPHPHTLQTDYVANIVREFSNYSRFIFDTSPSSYMDNYCRANLMITDMSGTAFTYAFTTLRPVVFFSHKEGEVEEAFNRVKYFRDREEIGYIATNTRELIEKIKLALKNKDKFKRKIRKFRDSVMFNVGRSEDYFVENFHYIAEDKKHPDWHYIPV